MRTVSDLLSLAGAKLTSDAAPPLAAAKLPDRPADNDKPTFADVGARIGEDNELLRNLLIDTSHQLGTLDDLKETFGKLVEPLNTILTKLEQEKATNASSQGALTAIRSSHETLRADFQGLEKKSSELQGDNERLGRDLAAALQNARELEDDRTKLGGELAAARTAMAMIVKQLGEETASVRVLSEQKGLLAERAQVSDKRIADLESEFAHARERLALLENDKGALQTALDKTLAESSRVSRRLAASESAFTDTRSRLQQTESNLAAAETERNKLATACDESNERRQSEVYALELKLDALRSHSDAAEKLLAEARQNLAARTQEIRVSESKLLEANAARSQAETKAEQLVLTSQGFEQQTRTLQQEGANLTERCKVLSETLTASESLLVHAKEKIKSLTGHVEQLQSDATTNRARVEEDIVQLNATIEHERCERSVAEGALETTRNDYARLQRQMAQERSTRRVDHQRRVIGTIPRP